MPGELLSSPLIEIAQALLDKRVTAQELVEAAIGRHERFGERLNAYSLWSPEQARVVAKAADAAFAAGVAVGPLQGLPVSINQGPARRIRLSLPVAGTTNGLAILRRGAKLGGATYLS